MTKKQVKDFKTNNPEAYLVFEEMAKRVGCKDFASTLLFNNWYTKYKWTTVQEGEFKQWLLNELKTNKALQIEMERDTGRSFKLARTREKFADGLLLNYGWSIKE